MTASQFDTILNNIWQRIKNLNQIKRNEYASDKDVLANFDKAASFLCVSPQQALFCFLTKHIISLRDIVLEKSNPSLELVREKITDTIIYLIILEAMYTQQKGDLQ